MSDVSALMDKLKSTVSYKQFDAPRSTDQAWPVLEKLARAQNALTDPDPKSSSAETPVTHPVIAPVAAPAGAAVTVEAAAEPAPPASNQSSTAGSLFARLQVDAASPKAGAFSRYTVAKPLQEGPQVLSEIFERIGRKAL